jgi:hypothetical protein
MDTFCAHTDTFVEVPLAALLLPGRYTVHLTVEDAAQGVRVDQAAITFVVEAPTEPAPGTGVVPDLTQVIPSAAGGQVPLAVVVGAIVLALMVGVLVAWLVLRRRRGAGPPGR